MATAHPNTHREDVASSPGTDTVQDRGVVETMKETAQEWAGDVGHRAVEARDRVMDWGSHACESTGHMMKTAGHEATDLICRYPLTSLLVGFGAGFLFAQLMCRRHS